MKHPYGLSKERIYELDEVWLHHVYWHEIDPKWVGEANERIKISAKRKEHEPSDKKVWLLHGRFRGWPDWFSLRCWKDEQELKAEQKEKVEVERKSQVKRSDTQVLLAFLEEEKRNRKRQERGKKSRRKRDLAAGGEPQLGEGEAGSGTG